MDQFFNLFFSELLEVDRRQRRKLNPTLLLILCLYGCRRLVFDFDGLVVAAGGLALASYGAGRGRRGGRLRISIQPLQLMKQPLQISRLHLIVHILARVHVPTTVEVGAVTQRVVRIWHRADGEMDLVARWLAGGDPLNAR